MNISPIGVKLVGIVFSRGWGVSKSEITQEEGIFRQGWWRRVVWSIAEA